uniref:Amiloride-sensitive sodium channel n=1 Tax=Angiostrongylus cantonensis TaxID=6313 RepID=A0A0K0DJG8_ANGCA
MNNAQLINKSIQQQSSTNDCRLELNSLFLQWRGNRTQYEIFDFVFNKNGYTCQEMFIFCRAGPRHFDCCSAFEATFVMLRGRHERLLQAGMVAHLGDSHVEVGLYPLLYLTVNNWNHLHFVQRKVSMVPEKNLCSTDPLNQGKSTCFVYNWVNRVMVPTLNCTLPFFKTMLPYTANLSVCEPLSVIGNYYHITSKRIRNYGCLPACERVENHWQITSNIDERALAQNGFGFEASFNELEYEHYLETHTTTPARFISELGSQCGLFVGGSLVTLIQLLFTVVIFTFGFIRKAYRTYIAVLLVIRT